jgi:hypothetical protein
MPYGDIPFYLEARIRTYSSVIVKFGHPVTVTIAHTLSPLMEAEFIISGPACPQ